MSDGDQWYIIPCPAGIQLTSIMREKISHGHVYCLWECERRMPAWLGQSIPALVRSINEKVVLIPEKRLHASSLYRTLRQQCKKQQHKCWKCSKYNRSEIAELNLFLANFPSIVVVSKSPELWHCNSLSVREEAEEPEDVAAAAGELKSEQSPSGSEGGASSERSA
jgi:hypothetical protein